MKFTIQKLSEIMKIALRKKAFVIAILLFLSGRLASAGEEDLAWSTFLGGSDYDLGYGIAVDDDANVYLTGVVTSADFPKASGIVDTLHGGRDLLVAKLFAPGDSLIFTTLLGGSEDDEGKDIQLDSKGHIYVTGVTNSEDFPVSFWALDTTFNGSRDVVAVKLDPSGSLLYYSTYLGGMGSDWGHALAVSEDETVCLTGYTDSPDFPTTSDAYDTSYNGGHWDAFVARLSKHGDFLDYGTYLGGQETDSGQDVAIDGQGRMIVAGSTASTDFPVTGAALDVVHNGGLDAFVAKFEAQGDWLSSATYLGGGLADQAFAVAVDDSGYIFLTGKTLSDDFPVSIGAYDETYNGTYAVEAFVSKLGPEVETLEFSTFLGGAGTDEGHGLALDDAGNVYVTGWTYSDDFPSTPDSYSPSHSGSFSDVFLAGLDPSGSQLIYGTFLGGAGIDLGWSLAVDHDGFIYLTGETKSDDFPTTPEAFCDTITGDYADIFVTKLNLFGTPVESEDLSADVPKRCSLRQNYPNPFNARTEIRYLLTGTDHVSLRIFNTLGQQVRVLVDERLSAGEHSTSWDGRDDGHGEVASGVYFCRMEAGECSETVKMVVLR